MIDMPEIRNKTIPEKVPAAVPTRKRMAAREFLFLRMPLQDQIMFAKRLSMLIRAGIPILAAMAMLKKQTAGRHNSFILAHLHRHIEQGAFLSAGMMQFKNIFGEFAINIVRVGELSGTLQDNLQYLSEALQKKQELRRKIIGALVYPVFIVLATVGMVILLTAYVFPKIMPIFQSFKFQLPWTTRTLIFLSNACIHSGLYIALAVFVVGIGLVFLFQVPRVRFLADAGVVRLPLLGPMLRSYYCANFSRTLGLLLRSDVRIVEALQIAAGTIGNRVYCRQLRNMAGLAARGEKISSFMAKEPKLFPPILSHMVEVGEATGCLSDSLLFLAGMHEDDLDNSTKNLSSSIEPALMIGMGLLVGFIALSIITPIYGVTQNIHP